MPVPQLGRAVSAGAAAVLAFLLVGCGNDTPAGPRADQAGMTLQNQVYKILIVTTVIHPQVTDPLFDKYIPCGDGRVKLNYAVAGTATTFATKTSLATRAETKATAAPREIIDDLVRYLPNLGTFSVTRNDAATARLASAQANTRLTLHSPGPNKLTITGETNCLRGAARPGH
jgi:hypothetical protein